MIRLGLIRNISGSKPGPSPACGQNFSSTSYFDPAYGPGIHRSYIVDYESHPGIVDHVTVLLALDKTTVSPDLDRIFVGVVAKADGHHMGLTIPTDRRQAPETLTLKIGDLGSRESAHY
jgi:hypothetical protein